ncbi:fimbrial protein [Pseudomonas sp. PDNC002]|uniref:fimbrial protein n=1 Tax=Pseudomonas sp. PDNC002 TaxID=2811422 RepID=UPI001963799E|nr:fimbrial protein [Pseudomonas sp. PDNC002]QRY79079.1 fimbrial protein [Pseudomonas sp. PDNC002]
MYATGYTNVAVEIRWTFTPDGPCPTFGPFDITYSNTSFGYPTNSTYSQTYACGMAATSTDPTWPAYQNRPYGLKVEMRLMQLGAISSGTMTGRSVLSAGMFKNTVAGDGNLSAAHLQLNAQVGSTATYSFGSVSFVSPTCTVGNQIVNLDPVMKSDFTGTATPKDTPFQFTFNCDAGMNNVLWSLSPLSTILDASNGTFDNGYTGADKANGVGLRLTSSLGNPIVLNSGSYSLAGYNNASGNTALPLPLRVSYYLKGSPAAVTGGQVQGIVELRLTYQ